MTFQIGITATREGLTGPQLRAIIRRLHDFNPINTVIHQGCCVGGDEQITIAAAAIGIKICAHPPVDKKFFSKVAYELSDYKCTELPYLERNNRIIFHSETLFGAPKNRIVEMRGSGTWYTIRHARDLLSRVEIFHNDGGTNAFEYIQS